MPDAFPYPTASDEAVRAGAWTTSIDGVSGPLPQLLPDWDLASTLTASRELEIDLDRVYRDSGLDPDTPLALSVLFTSEFEDTTQVEVLDASAGTVATTLDADIAGRLLGATVELSTVLALHHEAPTRQEHVAWRRGSILWSDVHRVRLHGDASRFPVTELDFADHGLDPAAPWWVEIGPELDQPVMGSVQLLLNNRFPLVLDAARDLDPARPELAAVRSSLHVDIGRTLVEYALAQEDLDQQEWPDDSLGAILAGLLTTHFHAPITDLRALRNHDPAAWSAKLAATFGLFREPLG